MAAPNIVGVTTITGKTAVLAIPTSPTAIGLVVRKPSKRILPRIRELTTEPSMSSTVYHLPVDFNTFPLIDIVAKIG